MGMLSTRGVERVGELMKSTSFAIAIVVAGLAMQTSALAQGTHDGHQAAPASTTMSCEHHKSVEAALDRIQKIVADTKESSDAATLRRALDEVTAETTKLQSGSKKCEDMMEMMKKMHR